MRDEKEILNRWRLALGRYAEGPVHFSEGSLPYGEMDQVLEFLYSREYGEEQEIRKDRGGSGNLVGSALQGRVMLVDRKSVV